jgi:hypothetical protein
MLVGGIWARRGSLPIKINATAGVRIPAVPATTLGAVSLRHVDVDGAVPGLARLHGLDRRLDRSVRQLIADRLLQCCVGCLVGVSGSRVG